MAARSIDGPEKDWLTAADLVALLRVSKATLKRLIASGEFPRAMEVSPGIRLWSWRDVVYWQLKIELRSRMGSAPEEKT